MRRFIPLLLILSLVLLPSCAPSDDFQGGQPVTPDELESISSELFGTEEQPTDSDDGKEANPNTMVYWLKDGTVYHPDPDCSHLEGKRNVKETTLRTAEANGLRMCKDCQSK